MAAPLYSQADYLAALQALLPSGRAWPREGDAVQTLVLSGLAAVYVRTNARANQVTRESLPATTFELLPEWEATLGLPDPCAGVSPTVQARRAQVVARFASVGGQSIAYYQQFAANLGFMTYITQYAPARAGQLRVGQPVCSTAWANAWSITAPLNTINPFLAGVSCAGEPLSSSGNSVLECEMQSIAPAHTKLFFKYNDADFALAIDAAANGEASTLAGVNGLHDLVNTRFPSLQYW